MVVRNAGRLEGVGVVNPSFDVMDSLVTGIIAAEKGIAYEPFKESFEKMGIKPVEKIRKDKKIRAAANR